MPLCFTHGRPAHCGLIGAVLVAVATALAAPADAQTVEDLTLEVQVLRTEKAQLELQLREAQRELEALKQRIREQLPTGQAKALLGAIVASPPGGDDGELEMEVVSMREIGLLPEEEDELFRLQDEVQVIEARIEHIRDEELPKSIGKAPISGRPRPTAETRRLRGVIAELERERSNKEHRMNRLELLRERGRVLVTGVGLDDEGARYEVFLEGAWARRATELLAGDEVRFKGRTRSIELGITSIDATSFEKIDS